MSAYMYLTPVDGVAAPYYAGDTIKYLYTVLDEDGLPFTGVIVDVRFELMQNIEGVPLPLDPPVVKTLTDGVTVLTDNVVEVILINADTADLPAACYTSAIRVRSADFGDMTNVRRLHLERNIWN